MWKNLYSKGQLTIHRKTTKQCIEKYWGGMESWEICENDGCGKLFPTYDDMQKHMFYRCKNNEENPLLITIRMVKLIGEQRVASDYQVETCSCLKEK